MTAIAEEPGLVPMGTALHSRRKLWLAGAVVVTIALAALVNWWLTEGRYIETTDNATIRADIVALGSRIEGDVIAIPVAENQTVRAGDPLILLDPTDWRARLDQARGAAGEARAAAAVAKWRIDQARAALDQARAMVGQAQAEQVRALAEAGRNTALLDAGWTSRQANDTVLAVARKAQANLAAALAIGKGAETELQVSAARAEEADARLAVAEATVRLAEANLAQTVIRAPFDGVATNRAAQIGQRVQVGRALIAVVPSADRMYVTANFKETQLRRIRPGQNVTLVPDIDGSAVAHGRVISLAPATGALFSLLPPDNATGNYTKVVQRVPVRIAIDPSPDGAGAWIRAGLSVTVSVDTRGGDTRRRGILGVNVATLGITDR